MGVEGTEPLTYQWHFNTLPIIGATSSALTNAYVTPAFAGDYTVVVANSGGSITSAVATLTVSMPTVNRQPGTKRWEFATGGSVYSSPAIADDGKIYFGSEDQKLYALRPNGTKKWDYSAGQTHYGSPAIGLTPTEIQGPGVYSIAVRVTDDAQPSSSSEGLFSVTVNEVNTPPALSPTGDRTLSEGDTVEIAFEAVDVDLPGQRLDFTLDLDSPAGATIHPDTGVFSWTAPDR